MTELTVQWLLGYNFSGPLWLYRIVRIAWNGRRSCMHDALDRDSAAQGQPLKPETLETRRLKAPCHRLAAALMTVAAVLASLIPILLGSGVGSDVMKPIAAPIGSWP